MSIEDVIDSLNNIINSERGIFVLHRSMREHPKFKVYKRFCYNLYLVKGDTKDIVLTFEDTKNTPAEDILTVWKECDKLFLTELLKWIISDEFKNLL